MTRDTTQINSTVELSRIVGVNWLLVLQLARSSAGEMARLHRSINLLIINRETVFVEQFA